MIVFRIKEHIVSSNIQLSSIQFPGWCYISWRSSNPGAGDRGGAIHIYKGNKNENTTSKSQTLKMFYNTFWTIMLLLITGLFTKEKNSNNTM